MATNLGPPPVAGVRPLSILTLPQGFPEGSIVDPPSHEIVDTSAAYIQDAILIDTGTLRTRGNVKSWSAPNGVLSGLAVLQKMTGIASAFNPLGKPVIAVGVHEANVIPATFDIKLFKVNPWTSGTTISAGGSSAIPLFDAKPALVSGTLIGSRSTYYGGAISVGGGVAAGGTNSLVFWRGATLDPYSAGTITTTVNSPVVTGAGTLWAANVEAGMFLIQTTGANLNLIGVVKSVDSNTQITLEQNALIPTAAGIAYTLQSYRGLAPTAWAAAGRITAATSSPTVNGGKTKFVDQGVAAGWFVFAEQGQNVSYLGTVNTVASNTQLALVANSTTAVTNARVFCIKPNLDYRGAITQPVGTLNASWKGYQFFFNRDFPGTGGVELSRLYVTDFMIDGVDVSKNGTTFDLPATSKVNSPGTGIMGTETGVLLFRESDAWILTGDAISNFVINHINDDGCISSKSIIEYGGGALWAGLRGVYMWDGVRVTNLLEGRANLTYARIMDGQTPDSSPVLGAMVVRDHYLISLGNDSTNYNTTSKGGATQTSKVVTWAINLKTGGITFLTNVRIEGSAIVPTVGAVYGGFVGSNTYLLGYGPDLFADTNAADTVVFSNCSVGPDFYLETKMYDGNAPELLKLWKQVQLWHLTEGGDLTIDVLTGLQKTSTTLASTPFTTTASYLNKRVKFLKRSTHLGFKLYRAGSNTRVKLGPFAIGFKPQRAGRI